MSKSRKQHIEEIIEAMHSVRRTFASQWSKSKNAGPSAITPSQWMALVAVSRKDSMSVAELSEMLGITSSAATQLVDELVIKKFLFRQDNVNDRRTTSLSLTQTAKKKIEDIKSKQIDKFTHMFEGLSDKELEQYTALNKKISDHLLKK